MFAALAAARFAHLTATCVLFGLAAFPFYVPAEGTVTRIAFTGLVRSLSVLALVTGALELLAMAGDMGDSWRSAFDPQIIASATTDTAMGRVWAWRLVLAAAIVALSLREHRRDPVLLGTSGVLLASIALTGHSAMPGGGIGAVHRLADAAHLLAAGWWIGGLLALLLASRTLGGDAPAVLRRFSRIGYAAVATLIATGTIKSLILVKPLSSLWETGYGWVLIAKVALFWSMGLLALSNRALATPALQQNVGSAGWLSRLHVQVAAEFALGLAVLALVGALGAMEPPMPA